MPRTVKTTVESNYESVPETPDNASVICTGTPYTPDRQLSVTDIQQLRHNVSETRSVFCQN